MISSRLASGLCVNLWNDISATWVEVRKLLSSSASKPNDPASVRLNKLMDRYTIVKIVGGSKKHPYGASIGLMTFDKRPYNHWNEKCLWPMVSLVTSYTDEFLRFRGVFTISEHAIKRIFERNKKITTADIKTQINVSVVMQEMSFVPLLTTIWMDLIFHSEIKEEHIEHYHPIIPTENGLFLCEVYRSDAPAIEIRTFVSDDELSFEQSEFSKVIKSACERYKNSPICFEPYISWGGIEFTFMLKRLLVTELAAHKELLAKQLFMRCDDDNLRIRLRQEFMMAIDTMSLSGDVFDEFSSFSHSKVLSVTKQIVLKDGSAIKHPEIMKYRIN